MEDFGTNRPSGSIQIESMYPPRIGDAFRQAWSTLWQRFPILFLGGLIYFAIAMAVGGIFSLLQKGTGPVEQLLWSGLSVIAQLLLVAPLGYGVAYFYLRVVRGDDASIEDLFTVFSNYGNAVLAGILVSIITLVGFVLLIVPGIIFSCKLIFVPYLIVDRRMGAIKAIQESWAMTKGYATDVFLMFLLCIPIAIAGAIVLLVGLIPAMMWIALAFAAYYNLHDTYRHPKKSSEFEPIKAV